MSEPEWKLRERHSRALDEVHLLMGNKDRHHIFRFDSRVFWPEFEKRGHDNGEFERCKCSKEPRHG